MTVIHLTSCLMVLTAGIFPSASAKGLDGKAVTNYKMDAGNWSVGDCILAQFAMEFTVHTDEAKKNATKLISLPSTAKAEKDDKGHPHCSNETGKYQSLSLSWKERQLNITGIKPAIYLDRYIVIQFARKPNMTYYGVNRVYGQFVLALYNETVTNKTGHNHTEVHKSTLILDSKLNDKLMFHTPNDRSYLCADVGQFSLVSTIQYDYPKFPEHSVENTTVHATHVQFDAFRNLPTHVPKEFRTPIDCDYQPNDIVPIAVGVALAALVVAVLVAYMVGRRRNRQRGYQSV